MKEQEILKCVMCDSQARFTAEANYRSGVEKELLCASCKMVDEQIRKLRGDPQTTE